MDAPPPPPPFMDPAMGFDLPGAHFHHPTAPYGLGPSIWNDAGAMNPFGYGPPLDLACPPPAGHGPFYGGETEPYAPDLLGRPQYAGYGPFSGGGVATSSYDSYPAHTNPFSFGFDLAPPLVGYNDAFAGVPPWSNPFTADEEQYSGFGDPLDGATLAVDNIIPAPWGQYNTTVHAEPTEPATFAPAPDADDDIDAILRAAEQRAGERPAPRYLETTQAGRMGPEARAALVRFMGRVAGLFGPAPGTLHRAVAYADRFLSACPLPADDPAALRRQRLRLLGAAAVYVAAKYEDQGAAGRCANAEQLATRCGGVTTREDVLEAERALLAQLDHRVGGPTAFTFVEWVAERCVIEEEVRRAAHRFAEVALRDYGCVEMLPSAVAAAAVFLARLTTKPSYGQVARWNRELKEVTGYKPRDLKYAVEAMCSLMRTIEPGFDVVIFAVFYADP
ncbi:hypothetical protein QOZ80_2BG0192490 [Eleusine coracana subsp. coracana]|nr:hypothetical protein QOZ80_2BG0192490 [Eleusine coracana subsp. coracana]